MYFTLSTKDIELEYISEIITVTHKGNSFRLHNYEINNFNIIINNLHTGVCIDSLVMESLVIKYDSNETLHVGTNNFTMSNKYLDDLVILMNQADNIRLRLLRPKKAPSSGSGTMVTNHV